MAGPISKKTVLKHDSKAWDAVQIELDKIWKDLSDALKKADKVLADFEKLAPLTPAVERRKSELAAIIQHCEADKFTVEYATKWRKDQNKSDLTITSAQAIQATAAGHLCDLIDAYKAAKATLPAKRKGA